MNERIKEIALECIVEYPSTQHWVFNNAEFEKFVGMVVKECANAVLSVPSYYKDYRSQIEEAVIHDCARAVEELNWIEP